MRHRMSENAHTVYVERRTADKERTMNRRQERDRKAAVVRSFGGLS